MLRTLEAQLNDLADYTFGEYHRTRFGLPTLDSVIGGPAPGEVATIIGRSFTAKSILAQNIVLNNPQVPSIFFSLEMPANQALIRLFAMFKNVDVKQVQAVIDRRHLPDDLYDLVEGFPKHRIVDVPDIDAGRMSMVIDQYEDEVGHKVEFAMLDYLELMGRDPNEEKGTAVEGAFVGVRAWARERNVRLFLIHQGNMSTKVWEPPTADSPRYAGMAQSDFLVGLWRPHKDPQMMDSEKRYYRNKLMLNVLKNRVYFEEIDKLMLTITPSLRLVEGDVLSIPATLYASGDEEAEFSDEKTPVSIEGLW